jgi:hypothetical protein
LSCFPDAGEDDFKYSDNGFHDPDPDDSDVVYVANEDGGRHTKWLTFMAPRLYLLWEMLNDDRGVIFVNISAPMTLNCSRSNETEGDRRDSDSAQRRRGDPTQEHGLAPR